MRQWIFVVFGLLLSISPVLAIGVSYPNELELMPNQAGRISFSVQLVKMETSTCTFSIEDIEPLIWELDRGNEVIFDAGSVNHIYGTIRIPRDAEIKTYEGKLKVHCSPHVELVGTGSKITQSMGVPIKIEVVGERTKENLYVPPKPIEWYWFVLGGVAIITVCGLGVYAYKRHKRKEEEGDNSY